jgi:uncharacterized membrane protein
MQWNDDRVDRMIGTLLRAGVVISSAVVLAGSIWYLSQAGGTRPDYNAFRGEPEHLRSITGIIDGVVHGTAASLMQFGLLLLIATPVARVAFSVFAFSVQRDRMYVAITLVVLGILVCSLMGLTAAR